MRPQVLDHPLAGHLLAGLRDRTTEPDRFRLAARTLTSLLALQATTILRTREETVETPLASTTVRVLDEGLAAIPVLRAGLAMLEPVVELFPDVAVGYIGLERDETTAVARRYYMKLPRLTGRYTLVLDPMLATGGSAVQAIAFAKELGAARIAMVSVVAAPEGIAKLNAVHPDVPIIVAAIDERLDERSYIFPGLGDFGDRLYGTF